MVYQKFNRVGLAAVCKFTFLRYQYFVAIFSVLRYFVSFIFQLNDTHNYLYSLWHLAFIYNQCHNLSVHNIQPKYSCMQKYKMQMSLHKIIYGKVTQMYQNGEVFQEIILNCTDVKKNLIQLF